MSLTNRTKTGRGASASVALYSEPPSGELKDWWQGVRTEIISQAFREQESMRVLGVSVVAEATARATADGWLEGKYTLTVTAGNVVTGMELTSADGPGTAISQVIFNATKFQIYNGVAGVVMFDVSGTTVRLGGTLVVNTAGSKVYIGTGNWGNADTAFFVDSAGRFSLKDSLTWDGTSLGVVATAISIVNPASDSQFSAGQDATHRLILQWEYDIVPASAYAVIATAAQNNKLYLQAKEFQFDAVGLAVAFSIFQSGRAQFGAAADDGVNQLHVLGGTYLDGKVHIIQADTGTSASLILDGSRTDNKNTLLFKNSYWLNTSDTYGLAYIRGVDSGAQGGHLAFGTTTDASGTTGVPTERMRLTAAGCLGLGTTLPLRALHLVRIGADETKSGIIFTDDAAGNYRSNIIPNFSGGVAALNKLQFLVSNGTVAGQVTPLILTGDGNANMGGTLTLGALSCGGATTGALTTDGGLQTFGAPNSGGAGFRLVLVPN